MWLLFMCSCWKPPAVAGAKDSNHLARNIATGRANALQLLHDLTRPSASCPGRLRRLGGAGDGGYVVCDDLPPLNGPDCLVYSFGIRGNFVFENVLNRSGCSVHGYDPTVASRPGMRFNFHRLGLSNKEGTLPRVGEVATLSQIMRANGHKGRRLTLLKCDIEGSEWDALSQILSDAATLASLQHIVIELHLGCHKCPSHVQEAGSSGHTQWMRFFQPTLNRLRELFDLYYAYPNTCDCASGMSIDGVNIPTVWELSLAKKGLLPPFPTLAPSNTNGYGEHRCSRSQSSSCVCTCQTSDAASCMCTTRIKSSSQDAGNITAQAEQQAVPPAWRQGPQVKKSRHSPALSLSSLANVPDNTRSSNGLHNHSKLVIVPLPAGSAAFVGRASGPSIAMGKEGQC